jgi:hypothetical protein
LAVQFNYLTKELMMKHKISRSLLSLLVLLVGTGMALAGQVQYEITITNLTKGQPFSPTVVAVHNGRLDPIFTLGQPSSEGIWRIAEGGDTSVLAPQLSADPNVYDVKVTEGPFLPGKSVTVVLNAGYSVGPRYLSLAGMLGSTNDAFYALNGQLVTAPAWPFNMPDWVQEFFAPAYDAGSEFNSETCETVPGPPCDNGVNDRDTDGAEGYVYIHGGIHGVSGPPPNGLSADMSDWRNPVAKITIRVSRHGF